MKYKDWEELLGKTYAWEQGQIYYRLKNPEQTNIKLPDGVNLRTAIREAIKMGYIRSKTVSVINDWGKSERRRVYELIY